MSTDEFGEKTEEASERRREDERRKGNVARSSELSTSGHLLTYAAIFYLLGATFVAAVGSMMVTLLSTAHAHNGTRSDVQAQFKSLAIWAGDTVLPWMGAMVLAALAVNFAQVGFLIATEKLTPNPNLINPLTGLKKIFSIRSVVTLSLSLCKLTMLMCVVYYFMQSRLAQMLSLSNEPVLTTFATIGNAVVELSLLLAMILLVLGLVDFGFQKWKYEQEIMMTKEEQKRESKDSEGDPKIRQRRREIQIKLARGRDISETRNATLGIANPTHFFVAIRYEPPEYPLPIVIAKGVDEVALRMRAICEENGIPVIERPELARRLHKSLRVGEGIPVDLYEVFAEILKYVYSITGRTVDLSQIDAD